MLFRTFSILLLLMCVGINSPASPTDAADRAALLKDVHRLVVPGGIPGDLVVFGDRAFTVVTGQMGKANLPVFAGSRYGKGRILLGGHEGFFGGAAIKTPDNAQFAANIAAWLAGKRPQSVGVLLLGESADLHTLLADQGYAVTDVTAGQLNSTLNTASVLWMNQASLDGNGPAIDAVRRWVQAGGGLAITGPGWGWQSINASKELAVDQSGNRIAIPMGVAFSGGMLGGRRSEGFDVDNESIADTSATEALADLEAQAAGTKTLNNAELNQITTSLGQAVGILPATEGGFVRRVTALCADKGSQIPSRQTPITTGMPFARLKASLDIQRMRKLAPDQVRAHPSAASFPGLAPADAKRETKTVKIDTRVPEWHGLGLFAPAGEVVTVTVPSAAAGKGFGVRIGSHTDTLWHLDKWERFPEVSMQKPLAAAVTRIASPFGGTIFIEVPGRSDLGDIEVTVSGAIAAPRFVRGVTTNEDWKQSIRNAPGPWAELEGKLVAISVPSSAVRDLDDPGALMAYWDEVLENCYALYAAPKRSRPERYCVDRQISAGYMHSGYPIMTGDDVAKTFCDVSILRGSTGIKCWGFYHEMGHNFQRPEWTWAPFGEVTNNLFSLYGAEKMNGVMVGAHPAMTAIEIAKREHIVSASPGSEPYYSKDPWYPLTMFWLMRQEFGWEPYTKLFAEFRDLPNGQRPRNELQKHDQFLERFSRLTGRNLSVYLKAWGIDFSDKAVQTASAYPQWLPKDWK